MIGYPSTARNEHRRLEDARLQRRHKSGDRQAAAELAERYLPLARRLALRYRNRGEPLDDLIQVASVGLVNAVRRWDPDRGTAFATFAVPTILGELRRHFRDTTWAVRPPRSAQELSLAVSKARDRLWQHGSRAPTVADDRGLARPQPGGGARRAQGRRRAPRGVPGRADPEGGEETITGLDVLGGPEAGYGRVENALVLDQVIAILDEQARAVVRMRFLEDLLQREIAQRLGCSQMQVSRILRDSLSALGLNPALAR